MLGSREQFHRGHQLIENLVQHNDKLIVYGLTRKDEGLLLVDRESEHGSLLSSIRDRPCYRRRCPV